jgi:hypothetical protein
MSPLIDGCYVLQSKDKKDAKELTPEEKKAKADALALKVRIQWAESYSLRMILLFWIHEPDILQSSIRNHLKKSMCICTGFMIVRETS